MGHLWRMAWRNVGRNRRRSALAILSVAVAILFVVFMQGFVGGFLQSMVKNYTRYDTGHVRVTQQQFVDEQRFMPVAYNIQDPGAVRRAIETDAVLKEKVDAITERIQLGLILSHDGRQKVARGLAGDPETERDLLRLDRAILPGGRYLSGEREAIMGQELADALGHKVGDTVRVMAQGADDALHLRKLTLVGTFRTGLRSLDASTFMLGLEDARQLLRMGKSSQQVLLMLHDHRDSVQVAERLRSGLSEPGLKVASWTEVGDIYNLVQTASSIYGFVYLAVALLGAIIIGNIMMVVILERRREIGILRAMGFSPGETLVLFTCEGALLGLLGSLVGGLLGLGLVVLLHFKGLDLTAMNQVGNMPMDNIIYFDIRLASWLRAVAMGTLVSTLMAALPARRAARMGIIDAMKAV